MLPHPDREVQEEVSAMSGKPSTVRMHGTLQPYAQGFATELFRQGYAEGTVMHHMYLLSDLSSWLTEQRMDPIQLSHERAAEFLRDRRAGGTMHRSSPRGLAPLLAYLRQLGAVPEPVTRCATTQAEKIVEEFTGHLAKERGLAQQT